MKKIRRMLAIFFVLAVGLSCCTVLSAGALKAGAEVRGKTVCQALGMDGAAYMNWLQSHEHDNYYLGTPYRPYDHRNPNGDCKGAYGTLDLRGVPGMNCMGFVWHVLYKATAASGGSVSKVEAAMHRLTFYRGYNITRKYFKSKEAMLQSGYLEKGDIIWMILDQNEDSGSVYHHTGIYWGDGHSDVLWHSNTVTGGRGECNAISEILPMKDRNTMYIVLKVGAVTLPAPTLRSAVNTEDGIRLTWDKVSGAAKYRVFIKEAGKWQRVADTDKTSFTYQKAADGADCTFTVRCITATGKGYTGMYNKSGISCRRCSAPEVKTDLTDRGVRLSWSPVRGASNYRVYVSTGQGYAKLADTAATSYLYTAAQSGRSYTFTVRSLPDTGDTGAYRKSGFTIRYIAAPVVSKISHSDAGVTLRWDPPAGAVRYRVFQRQDKVWRRLGDTAACTFTDAGAVGEGVFAYTVRCISADGKRYTSYYDRDWPSLTVSKDDLIAIQ